MIGITQIQKELFIDQSVESFIRARNGTQIKIMYDYPYNNFYFKTRESYDDHIEKIIRSECVSWINRYISSYVSILGNDTHELYTKLINLV